MHRFRGGAWPIAPGSEKFIQYLVFIGGKYQLPDRQAHHARHMTRTNITKITRRHGKRHLLAYLNG